MCVCASLVCVYVQVDPILDLWSYYKEQIFWQGEIHTFFCFCFFNPQVSFEKKDQKYLYTASVFWGVSKKR